jgi:Na+/H+ antiporter NhaD/arsenite permease-like protein
MHRDILGHQALFPLPMNSFFTTIPFILLLLCIAILPLATPHFWEKNKNKAFVSLFLSIPIAILLGLHAPQEILHTVKEYFSFICLLGSLFVVSGGISVTGDLRATPKVNTLFLAMGAVLANLIGTTGASMVLIRAFLKTNSERHHSKHLPVFFIFVVANCGGLLTPLGDPPLFLGYLRGVPFFWTLKLFPVWLFMIGSLLTIFYVWDSLAYKKELKKDLKEDRTHIEPLRLNGLINLVFLCGIIGAAFLPTPWRECVMIGLALLSLGTSPQRARQENHFTWRPILEVAILFAGIFITMVPALTLLKQHGPAFGINQPWHFFWLTGSLSSFLDNAPTYLTFLSLAQGLNLSPEVVGVSSSILKAISVGAVFMGANTYIGNGPNFMVKAIADQARMKTPSFFGYMLYAVCILVPLYCLVQLIFF